MEELTLENVEQLLIGHWQNTDQNLKYKFTNSNLDIDISRITSNYRVIKSENDYIIEAFNTNVFFEFNLKINQINQFMLTINNGKRNLILTRVPGSFI